MCRPVVVPMALVASALVIVVGLSFGPAGAQAPAGIQLPLGFKMPEPTPNNTVVSPEVTADGRVTFRLYAPNAKTVGLTAEFLDFGKSLMLAKDARGVWSATTDPLAAGTYRYAFNADGVIAIDPRNNSTSSTNTTVQSLVRVTGADSAFEDTTAVPHGAVSAVYYRSTAFQMQRRMHVYTPPGYDKGNKNNPVLYLLHGGGDADESWSTTGRAGFILDNLIAAGKAVPMIVVMSAAHAPPRAGQVPGMPAVGESAYRVVTVANRRALAGLSMGGIQAANIGLTHAGQFPYIGIFSSGWFPDVLLKFETTHTLSLEEDRTRLKLLWVGYGKTDIAHDNARAMLKMFDRHQLHYTAAQFDGGHTWYNRRHYFSEFAPLLFK